MSLCKVEVNGIRIAYRWDGPAGAPVVMMAHAMGTSHRLWDWQIPRLADQFRVLRYDWRGHGDTDAPPGPYTLETFVADATGLMDALGLQRVHWVGISTGGMIGQGVAIAHGQRLMSLTLCNTTSQANERYREWVRERQAVVRRDGMGPVWDMTRKLWFTDDFVNAGGESYEAVRHVFVNTEVSGYLGGTSAVADLAYRDHLHKISVPTHIIAAGDDTVTPISHALTIQERIRGSTLSVIDGQRHFSNVEVPALFNDSLESALTTMIRSS